jgi:hypothetical protein
VRKKQTEAWQRLCAEYSTINTENVYPVEQFSYCDELAHEMGIMPTRTTVRSLRTWMKITLTPISTIHYVDAYFDPDALDRQKVYMPTVLCAFLALMRLLGSPFRWIKHISSIAFPRLLLKRISGRT